MLTRVCFVVCGLLIATSTAFARSNTSEAQQAQSFPLPPIRATAGVVMDGSSGEILGGKNLHLRLPMASTTKIMTAVLALQTGSLTDRITVPREAFNFEWDATVMGLRPGQVVTLQDLLYGLLLPSGADAANTIAIHYGRSEAGFVAMMNREAAVLGMRDTHYANAHGLTAAHHFTSAYDLAILARYASTLPALMKTVATKTYRWNGHVLTNLNRPIFWYPGLDGIKPGYTDDAGLCQVLDANRADRHVIVTLLHTPDLDIDSRNLLNFGLRDFSWVRSPLPGDGPGITLGGVDTAGSYLYFPASGHYLRAAFIQGYLERGGLSTLGFPRTELLHEGKTQVQYFQNGALMRDVRGQIARPALGLTPVAQVTPTATPSPTSSATPTVVPREATLVVPTGTRTPGTPAIALNPVSTAKATATSVGRPPVTPTITPHRPVTGKMFAHFQQIHKQWFGTPLSDVQRRHGYEIQVFTYGALAYDSRKKSVLVLPIGDRLLQARGYLPEHPGTIYPSGFASWEVLKATGWLESGVPWVSR